jgi:hypothetical protein
MCRVCASEAARFPEESAQFCYVLFNQVEARLAAYLRRNSELCYLCFLLLKICLATCLSADLGPFCVRRIWGRRSIAFPAFCYASRRSYRL